MSLASVIDDAHDPETLGMKFYSINLADGWWTVEINLDFTLDTAVEEDEE